MLVPVTVMSRASCAEGGGLVSWPIWPGECACLMRVNAEQALYEASEVKHYPKAFFTFFIPEPAAFSPAHGEGLEFPASPYLIHQLVTGARCIAMPRCSPRLGAEAGRAWQPKAVGSRSSLPCCAAPPASPLGD